MSEPITSAIELLGRRIHPDRLVLLTEVGSVAQGLNVTDQDDHDYTAVWIESFGELVDGPQKRQSMMIRSKPEGERSEPGDIDINVYTLRKFVALARKGNPSILLALFADPVISRLPEDRWEELAQYLQSKRAGGAFLGYMKQQMERWKGERGQKNVSRPELVERYGFDTKYAAHIVRLGIQGTEYMLTGRFTVPMPAVSAWKIKALRTGGVTEREAMAWAEEVEEDLKRAIDQSTLPDEPNEDRTHLWLRREYQRSYGLGT